MKLIHSKSTVKCSVDHLYKCITDIYYLKNELKLSNKSSYRKLSVNYDRSSPFSVGKKIIIKGESACITIIIQDNQPPSYLEMMITPGKRLRKVMGTGTIKINLVQHGEFSRYDMLVESDKESSGLGKAFVKIFALGLKISSWSSNRRFIKYVESWAYTIVGCRTKWCVIRFAKGRKTVATPFRRSYGRYVYLGSKLHD